MALFNYECDEVKHIIDEVSPNYPQLTTYEKEWLYFHKNGYIPGIPVELEYETVNVNPTGMVSNAIPFQYKSAILKGNTKYRDIDTGDILDTFDETKNLKLVSVQMPVLTTSNEDGTITNILTVNDDVKLRGMGNVQDTLDLMTGEKVERIGEIVLDGSQSAIGGGYVRINNAISDWSGRDTYLLSDRLPTSIFVGSDLLTTPTLALHGALLYIRGFKSNEEITEYFRNNPTTVQYRLAKESIKTVALTPLNKPYEGTNYYELTSSIPCEAILEVPVVSTGKQTLEEINN